MTDHDTRLARRLEEISRRRTEIENRVRERLRGGQPYEWLTKAIKVLDGIEASLRDEARALAAGEPFVPPVHQAPPADWDDRRLTVGQTIALLQTFPPDAKCHAYEGEIEGIVISPAPSDPRSEIEGGDAWIENDGTHVYRGPFAVVLPGERHPDDDPDPVNQTPRLEVDAAALGLTRFPGNEHYHLAVAPGVRILKRGDHRLVVREHDQRVEWALLEWAGADGIGPGTTAEYDVLAHGYGYAGRLREARHTYFGEDGYVFYVDPGLLAWAFEQLREWFDFPGLPRQQHPDDEPDEGPASGR